jgi:ferredoxin
MTFVVTDACIRCKYMDCLLVCPADCFREGENMLVIDPKTCIDCAACWRACPAMAIEADSEPGVEQWIEHNRQYAALWPIVVHGGGRTPADADAHKGESGKLEKYFSAKPGPGDKIRYIE